MFQCQRTRVKTNFIAKAVINNFVHFCVHISMILNFALTLEIFITFIAEHSSFLCITLADHSQRIF